MDATLSSRPVSTVMQSPCAGDALDPPLWKVPNKSLSRSLFGSQKVVYIFICTSIYMVNCTNIYSAAAMQRGHS
jgi:hypothetical protein